jgi:hypothetical protein
VTLARKWRLASENVNVAYSDDCGYVTSERFSPTATDLHPHLYKYRLTVARKALCGSEAMHFESTRCCRNRQICSESSTEAVPLQGNNYNVGDVLQVMEQMLKVVEQVWLKLI